MKLRYEILSYIEVWYIITKTPDFEVLNSYDEQTLKQYKVQINNKNKDLINKNVLYLVHFVIKCVKFRTQYQPTCEHKYLLGGK